VWSPWEKENRHTCPLYLGRNGLHHSIAGIFQTAGNGESPLLGERVWVRASVIQTIPVHSQEQCQDAALAFRLIYFRSQFNDASVGFYFRCVLSDPERLVIRRDGAKCKKLH
jgi:hypothetical protein